MELKIYLKSFHFSVFRELFKMVTELVQAFPALGDWVQVSELALPSTMSSLTAGRLAPVASESHTTQHFIGISNTCKQSRHELTNPVCAKILPETAAKYSVNLFSTFS